MSIIEKIIENEINESSRSRILQHMGDHDTGFITASRGDKSKQENIARNAQLVGALHARGLGVTAVKGGYIENFGQPDQRKVSENSFFVVDLGDRGTLKEILKELGEKFEQDSILFVPKINNDKAQAILIGTSPLKDPPMPKGQESLIGSFEAFKHDDVDKNEYYTIIRNSPFKFESVTRDIPNISSGFFSRGWRIFNSMKVNSIIETIEKDKSGFFNDLD